MADGGWSLEVGDWDIEDIDYSIYSRLLSYL